MRLISAIAATGLAFGQTQIQPVVSQDAVNERVNIVRLTPRFTSAIRLPEAVSSVVIGDPSRFLAEHSEKEPALVLVKPVSEDPAESNLLVTTVSGRHLSFWLQSAPAESQLPVDFVLTYRPVGSFLVEESGLSTAEISATETLAPSREPPAAPLTPASDATGRDAFLLILERQQRAALPVLYGMRTDLPDGKGDRVKAGISEVVDQGAQVLVLFSVVNPQNHAVEILPPQIQLAGQVRKGFLVRRSRWGTSEQLAVQDFRLSRRRIGPGERADGLVLFARPSFKQANETLFLQIAESGAVDRPALAPIGFGVSAVRKENEHE